MERSGERLAPYFCNRVCEITRDLCEHTEVEPIQHVPGPHNSADLPTRETATISDLQPGSTRMDGPNFLHLEKEMPLSRSFLTQDNIIPVEELRIKKATILCTTTSKPSLNSLARLADIIMSRTICLQKAVNTMARLTKAVICHDIQRVKEPLTPGDIKFAYKLLFTASMGPTLEAVELTS